MSGLGQRLPPLFCTPQPIRDAVRTHSLGWAGEKSGRSGMHRKTVKLEKNNEIQVFRLPRPARVLYKSRRFGRERPSGEQQGSLAFQRKIVPWKATDWLDRS